MAHGCIRWSELAPKLRAALLVALAVLGVMAGSAHAAIKPIFVYTGSLAVNEGYSKFGTAAGRPVVQSPTIPDDLSGNACMILPVLGYTLGTPQIDAIKAFVNGGGSVIASGEYKKYGEQNQIIFPDSNITTPINGLATALGANITIQSADLDIPNLVNTFAFDTTNIFNTPLTAGVSLLEYAATTTVGFGAPAVEMARTVAGSTFIVGQKIGGANGGWFVVSGDSNVFSNNSRTALDPGDVHDNDVLARNICGNKPPTVSITSPLPLARYRVNGPAGTAQFTCNDPDGPEDIVSCVGSTANNAALDVSTPGTKTLTVTATDSAGQVAVGSVQYVVDGSPPTITPNIPAEGGEYQRGFPGPASFTCGDLDGPDDIATCSSTPFDTATLGPKTLTITATDKAGNTSTLDVNYTVVDKRPPTITITTPAAGATYLVGASLKAAFTCTDPDNDIATCIGTLAVGKFLDTSVAGTFGFTVDATDTSGNAATKTVTYTVVPPPPPRANSPPAVSISSPKDGATYAVGQKLLGGFACTDPDGPSDIASCTPNADPSTAAAGTFTFTVTAKDQAGATASRSVTYKVAAGAVAPVTAAGTRVCKSRRSFRIRVKKKRGVKIVSATVFVNGKRVQTKKGKRVTATVTLKGLKKGRYRVVIKARLSDGRTVTDVRRFRTCTPKGTPL